MSSYKKKTKICLPVWVINCSWWVIHATKLKIHQYACGSGLSFWSHVIAIYVRRIWKKYLHHDQMISFSMWQKAILPLDKSLNIPPPKKNVTRKMTTIGLLRGKFISSCLGVRSIRDDFTLIIPLKLSLLRWMMWCLKSNHGGWRAFEGCALRWDDGNTCAWCVHIGSEMILFLTGFSCAWESQTWTRFYPHSEVEMMRIKLKYRVVLGLYWPLKIQYVK